MTIADTLREARRRIEEPEKWGKGSSLAQIDAIALTITKLVQALRLIQGHSTNCRDVDIATEALAELEKP